jgi:hypothetical protein
MANNWRCAEFPTVKVHRIPCRLLGEVGSIGHIATCAAATTGGMPARLLAISRSTGDIPQRKTTSFVYLYCHRKLINNPVQRKYYQKSFVAYSFC